MSYDIILKQGLVIDPAQGIHDIRDIGIYQGNIAEIASELPSNKAKKVIDVQGMLVTPGLIDIHTHVAESIMPIAVTPDEAGVKSGVTTVCDAGSVGYATFNAFKKLIKPYAQTDIFCFLHLSPTGQAISPEICWESMDPQSVMQLIETEQGTIKGIKIRANGQIVADPDLKIFKIAKHIGNQTDLPIMIHIGLNFEEKISEEVFKSFNQKMLSLLDTGDIITHTYTQRPGGVIMSDGMIMSELKLAMERGVVLDIAPAKSHFSFDLAQIGLNNGIIPTTLSTDITNTNYQGPALFSLPVVMSKFLALGLSLNEVIEKTTIVPARILREDHRRGSLTVGFPADITIFKLLDGDFLFSDGLAGNTLEGHQLLEPKFTLKHGEEFVAHSRFLDHVPGEPITLTKGA
ncbi:MAG: amidohydrolase family protein [Candidatus Heimdallarchaeota archaeon]